MFIHNKKKIFTKKREKEIKEKKNMVKTYTISVVYFVFPFFLI